MTKMMHVLSGNHKIYGIFTSNRRAKEEQEKLAGITTNISKVPRDHVGEWFI